MSETMVRVTNISDREREVSWDGMPYAIPAGGHRDVSPVLGKHFQKRHPDGVTVTGLTTQHVAQEAPEVTRKCEMCAQEFQDTEAFIVHLGPCAIAQHEAAKPAPEPDPPAPEMVTVTLTDGISKSGELLGKGKNGFSRVRVEGTVREIPNRFIKAAAAE